MQSVFQHIYTLNTKTRLLHTNSKQQKIKQDGRKIYSSLFLIAEEHDQTKTSPFQERGE